MFQKYILIGVLGLMCLPRAATAQISELRMGIAEFDERSFIDVEGDYVGRANETSVSISGEVLFDEPKFLKWALSPQPYIGGSINLEGKTSFGGAGLLWRQSIGKKFYGDFALGLAIHDGTLAVEPSKRFLDILAEVETFENSDDIPEALRAEARAEIRDEFDRRETEIEFGSRVLFRLQGAIGYNVNKDWAGEVYVEHLSNGDIFPNESEFRGEKNEGVNILGVRAARKF